MVLDGKIYVMGGRGEDGVTLDMAEVYDPQADSWQRVASMPQGLYIHAAASMGGKIYVTGGAGGDEEVENSVFVYDLQADAWTQLASMSIARSCHASAAVGGKLYVFGGVGSNEGLVFSMTEVYDPASDSWVQGTSLTSAGQGLVAVAL